MFKNKIRLIIICSIFSAINIYSQQSKIDWKPFEFLLGNWIGEGSGDPGKGSGSFSLELALDKNILLRKNLSEYPAANDHPAFKHEDLLIVYPGESGTYKAIYFDNENHIINYSVTCENDKLVFLSEKSPSTPQFRLTYLNQSENKINILFEIAMPNNPEKFSKYLEGAALRQK